MKMLKYFILVFFLTVSSSQAWMTHIVGGGVPSEAGGNDYYFYYNPNDCVEDADSESGSCDLTGTLTNAAVTDDGADDYLNLTSGGISIDSFSYPTGFDSEEVYMRFIYEPEACTGNTGLFEVSYDASNYLFVQHNSSNRIVVQHGGSGGNTVNAADDNGCESLVTGYKNVVEVKFSVSNTVLDVRVCSTAGSDTTTCSGESWDTTQEVANWGTSTEDSAFMLGHQGASGSTDENRIYLAEFRTYDDAP